MERETKEQPPKRQRVDPSQRKNISEMDESEKISAGTEILSKIPTAIMAHTVKRFMQPYDTEIYHPPGITCLLVMKKIIVTGSYSGAIYLHTMKGKLLKMIKGHDEMVNRLESTPDGRLVSVSAKRLNVWDLSGENPVVLELDFLTFLLSVIDNDRLLITKKKKGMTNIAIWNTKTRSFLEMKKDETVTLCRLGPVLVLTPQKILSVGYKHGPPPAQVLIVWNSITGEKEQEIRIGESRDYVKIASLQDGKRIVIAANHHDHGTADIIVYNIEQNDDPGNWFLRLAPSTNNKVTEEEFRTEIPDYVNSMKLVQQGQQVALLSNNGSLRVLDIKCVDNFVRSGEVKTCIINKTCNREIQKPSSDVSLIFYKVDTIHASPIKILPDDRVITFSALDCYFAPNALEENYKRVIKKRGGTQRAGSSDQEYDRLMHNLTGKIHGEVTGEDFGKKYYFVKIWNPTVSECEKWIQLPFQEDQEDLWKLIDVAPDGDIVIASSYKIVIIPYRWI